MVFEQDLYRVIPAMTRDLGLQGLIRRTALFSHLWRQARDTEDLIYPRNPTENVIWLESILCGWQKYDIRELYIKT